MWSPASGSHLSLLGTDTRYYVMLMLMLMLIHLNQSISINQYQYQYQSAHNQGKATMTMVTTMRGAVRFSAVACVRYGTVQQDPTSDRPTDRPPTQHFRNSELRSTRAAETHIIIIYIPVYNTGSLPTHTCTNTTHHRAREKVAGDARCHVMSSFMGCHVSIGISLFLYVPGM
jgi:hypothetical protein